MRHLLLIGGQRCGSTQLSRLLDAHSRVLMCRPARPEPKVFCSDELTARGREWYLRTFFADARPGLLLGDKSTSYIEDPRAPGRAASMLGEPEVVAVLRDPVERAVSNWAFSTDNGYETRPLDEALRESLADAHEWDPTDTSVSPYAYLERGRYVDHLRPWVEQFPSTHIVFLADLLRGPVAAADLFDRLGIDPSVATAAGEQPVNSSSTATPGLSDDLLGRLRQYFSQSDRELAELVGRPLPWPTA